MKDLNERLSKIIRRYYLKKLVNSFFNLSCIFLLIGIVILIGSKFYTMLNLRTYLIYLGIVGIISFVINGIMTKPKKEELYKYLDKVGFDQRLQSYEETDKEPYKSLILEDIYNRIDTFDYKIKIKLLPEKKSVILFFIMIFIIILLPFFNTEANLKRENLLELKSSVKEEMAKIKKVEKNLLNSNKISNENKKDLEERLNKLEKSLKEIDYDKIKKESIKSKDALKRIEENLENGEVNNNKLGNELNELKKGINNLNQVVEKSDLKGAKKLTSDEFENIKKVTSSKKSNSKKNDNQSQKIPEIKNSNTNSTPKVCNNPSGGSDKSNNQPGNSTSSENKKGSGSFSSENKSTGNDFEIEDKKTNNQLNEFGQVDKIKIKKIGSDTGEYIDYKNAIHLYEEELLNINTEDNVPLEIRDYVNKYFKDIRE